MSESEKEKKDFLELLWQQGSRIIDGQKKMTLGDMERFSFLTEFFGLESYGIKFMERVWR